MRRLVGRHAVDELLASAPDAVAAIWVDEAQPLSPGDALLAKAHDHGIPVREEARGKLRSRSGGRGGARIAADVRVAPSVDVESLEPHDAEGVRRIVLALDRVTDPHNLGAILRTSAAFGVSAVVVPRDHSAPLNDAAVRASAGAVAHVPLVRVTNLGRTLDRLKARGFWVSGLAVEGAVDLWASDLEGPTVVVLGSEGHGLRPGVLKRCDHLVHLPLSPRMASVNVSVCAGVTLAEVVRQGGVGSP